MIRKTRSCWLTSISAFCKGGGFEEQQTACCADDWGDRTEIVQKETLRTPIRALPLHQGVKSGLFWIQQYVKQQLKIDF